MNGVSMRKKLMVEYLEMMCELMVEYLEVKCESMIATVKDLTPSSDETSRLECDKID